MIQVCLVNRLKLIMATQLDARAKRSQRALLQAGLELLNENRDATLSDIATHAGVGRATLYRQFDSREKLVKAVALYCIDLFDEVTAPIEEQATSALDAIRLLLELTMPFTKELQFLMSLDYFADDDPEILAIFKKHTQEMVELVDQAKQEGSIDKTLPSSWIVNFIEGLFYATWIQQSEEKSPPDEVARLAFSAFCNGLTKDA